MPSTGVTLDTTVFTCYTKHMVKLNEVAEAFAQNRAKGFKPAKAYRMAVANTTMSKTASALRSGQDRLDKDPVVQARIAELTGCLEEWRAAAKNNLIAQTEDLQMFLTTIVADPGDQYATGDRLKATDMLLRTHGAYKEKIEATISAHATMTYDERRSTLLEILHSNDGRIIDVPPSTPAIPDHSEDADD